MKRVLIVDDAIFMRKTLYKILEKNGFEIAGEAEDGEEAVEKYMDLKPDIVTMDITMPVMNGIEAVKRIKNINKDAIVIMISAMGQDPLVREAVIAGANGFIVKPFKEDHVMKAMTSL